MATDKDVLAAEAAALEKAAARVIAKVHQLTLTEGECVCARCDALIDAQDTILALITPEQASALAERLRAERLDEARWWHTRVAMAAMMADEPCSELREINRERIGALERTGSGPEAAQAERT